MWTRQYLQQQNQISARNMTDNPFASDGPYANVFGLEPDYREQQPKLLPLNGRLTVLGSMLHGESAQAVHTPVLTPMPEG